MNIIIKKPVVSEKSIGLTKVGWYTFLVDRSARKPQIAQAIEEQFGVDVVSIQTISVKPEIKMQRARRKYFSTSRVKKAVVKLKDGQKIKIFETEAKQPEEEPKELQVKEKKSLLKRTKVKIERGEK